LKSKPRPKNDRRSPKLSTKRSSQIRLTRGEKVRVARAAAGATVAVSLAIQVTLTALQVIKVVALLGRKKKQLSKFSSAKKQK